MSIDTDAMLIYGLHYKDIPDEILEEVNEMLDNGELDYASPYYDSDRDYWIVGVKVPAWERGHYDLGYTISNIDDEVPEILRRDDVELMMYVSQHVT